MKEKKAFRTSSTKRIVAPERLLNFEPLGFEKYRDVLSQFVSNLFDVFTLTLEILLLTSSAILFREAGEGELRFLKIHVSPKTPLPGNCSHFLSS